MGGSPTGAVVEYTWDTRNRLARVDFKVSLGGALQSSVSYEYDTQNRRIEKRADTDGNSTVDVSQKLIYDGMNLSQTLDAAGNTLEVFMSSSGDNEFLANCSEWLLADHQGTIRDRVTIATHVDNHVQYNAFGEILGGATGTSTATIGYTGQIWDASAGLYNFRNRWYDPKVGRFLSQDPIGFEAGDANLYRYVGNSPLSFTDPTGLYGESASNGQELFPDQEPDFINSSQLMANQGNSCHRRSTT